MKLRLLLLSLVAMSGASLMAQEATDDAAEQKFFTIGNFDEPGSTEILWGNGSFWERYPFQWYNTHSGGQFIYRSEYLEPLAEDNGEITEIVFKYGDEGSFVYVEAQSAIIAEYVDQREFEQKEGGEDYLWITFDPTAPSSAITTEVELYYMEDEEMHFVLSRPLPFEAGKSLLITAWSSRTNDEEAKAMVGYATRTDGMTAMVYGDDSDEFLDVYDSGVEYPYMDPNPVMPIIKIFYNPTDANSVSDVAVDANSDSAEFFTLAGARADADNLTPGLYIRRQGNKAEKIVVK